MSNLWKQSYANQERSEAVGSYLLKNCCVLTIDQKHARFFTFKDIHLKEKEAFFDPMSDPSDKAGYFGRHGHYGSGGGTPEKHTREQSKVKQYVHYIVQKTEQFLKENQLFHLIVLSAEKVYPMLKAELEGRKRDEYSFTITIGDFVKEPREKIEERIQKLIV